MYDARVKCSPLHSKGLLSLAALFACVGLLACATSKTTNQRKPTTARDTKPPALRAQPLKKRLLATVIATDLSGSIAHLVAYVKPFLPTPVAAQLEPSFVRREVFRKLFFRGAEDVVDHRRPIAVALFGPLSGRHFARQLVIAVPVSDGKAALAAYAISYGDNKTSPDGRSYVFGPKGARAWARIDRRWLYLAGRADLIAGAKRILESQLTKKRPNRSVVLRIFAGRIVRALEPVLRSAMVSAEQKHVLGRQLLRACQDLRFTTIALGFGEKDVRLALAAKLQPKSRSARWLKGLHNAPVWGAQYVSTETPLFFVTSKSTQQNHPLDAIFRRNSNFLKAFFGKRAQLVSAIATRSTVRQTAVALYTSRQGRMGVIVLSKQKNATDKPSKIFTKVRVKKRRLNIRGVRVSALSIGSRKSRTIDALIARLEAKAPRSVLEIVVIGDGARKQLARVLARVIHAKKQQSLRDVLSPALAAKPLNTFAYLSITRLFETLSPWLATRQVVPATVGSAIRLALPASGKDPLAITAELAPMHELSAFKAEVTLPGRFLGRLLRFFYLLRMRASQLRRP
jgi:hypothetical protein